MAVKVEIISIILVVCLVEYIYPRHIDYATPKDQDPDDLMSPDSADTWLYPKPDPHINSAPSKKKPPKHPLHPLNRKHSNRQHDEEVEATTDSKTETGTNEVKEPATSGTWMDKVGNMVPDWIKWDPSKWDPSKWVPH